MSEYIDDSSTDNYYAEFTGTKNTDYKYDADKQTIEFGTNGKATSDYTLPDAEFILYEVYDCNSNDTLSLTGATTIRGIMEYETDTANVATDVEAWRSALDTEAIYTTFKLKATHYLGGDSADVWEGTDSVSMTKEIDTGDITLSCTSWIINNDLFADEVVEAGGQTYSTAITIDNTKVTGSANHTGFPVMLTEDNFSANASSLFTHCTTSGGDLRFYTDSDGTTQIPHEIASIDKSGSKIEIYVKVPILDYNDDTTIYVRYGDTSLEMEAVDSTYGRNAVWSDYDRVYHFNQDPSTTDLLDSTGTYDGVPTGTWASGALVDGTVKKGWQFSGSNYVAVEDASNSLAFVYDGNNTYLYAVTNEFDGDGEQPIYSRGDRDSTSTLEYCMTLYYDTNLLRESGTNFTYDGELTDGMEMVITDRQTGSTFDVKDSNTVTDLTSGNSDATSDGDYALVGAAVNGGSVSNYCSGIISEVRLNNSTDKGDDWCTTERENLYNTSSFATASTPVAL